MKEPTLFFGCSGFWGDFLSALIAALFISGVMFGIAQLIEHLPW